MKLKLTSDSAGRILSVECDKDDEFAYVDAERVQRGDLDSFLPFACWKSGRSYELAYRVGRLPSLSQVLEAPIGSGHLQAVLSSILRMMHQCEQNNLSRFRVMLDLPHVFLDPMAAALRFAYVPMRSYVSPAGEVSLLAQLCRSAKVSGEDGSLVAAIWDYACRTTILTSVGFESFLREWDMLPPAEHAVSAASRPAPAASRPASRPAPAASAEHAASSPAAASRTRVVIEHQSSGARYELGEGVFTIGRSPSCTIALVGSQGVSREHARLIIRGGACLIEDLGSTNGVYVNGANIGSFGKARLSIGDRLSLAEERFSLRSG